MYIKERDNFVKVSEDTLKNKKLGEFKMERLINNADKEETEKNAFEQVKKYSTEPKEATKEAERRIKQYAEDTKNMKLYYIDTEGWVTEEWLLNSFINTTDKRKEYELLKKAVVTKTMDIQTS